MKWECFCDECYYHLWAVREVGEKRWGHCFHVQTQQEGEGLRDLLNELSQESNAPAEARCQASPPSGCSTVNLCQQCAAECDRSVEWDAFHYGIQARCDGCDQHTLCAMMPDK
jgi:hypothetical protein